MSLHLHNWPDVQSWFFPSRLSDGVRLVVLLFLPRRWAMMPVMGLVAYLGYVKSGCLGSAGVVFGGCLSFACEGDVLGFVAG